ncbi:histidine phosphatase family protein [Paenibacillus flagellatus]|uniref:histidine phosphatase family protein n=1 Tax=Paenibacillus flagellatus TaxID=2211139 RepID=UPI001FE87A7A|nr:histidine phosphatase family protein [Paenibacillus flagellatus]
MWERCTREPDYRPPVGDSAKQAALRLSSFLSEISMQHPPRSPIVLVTHGGLITDFLAHTFQKEDLDGWHPHFLSVQSSLVSECSITTLHYESGTFMITNFASVDHLGPSR